MGPQGRYSWFSSSSTTSSLRVWGTVAALAMMRNRESFMCHRDGVTSKEYGDSSVEIWKTDGWKWKPISSESDKFLRQRWQSTYSPLYSRDFRRSISLQHNQLTDKHVLLYNKVYEAESNLYSPYLGDDVFSWLRTCECCAPSLIFII